MCVLCIRDLWVFEENVFQILGTAGWNGKNLGFASDGTSYEYSLAQLLPGQPRASCLISDPSEADVTQCMQKCPALRVYKQSAMESLLIRNADSKDLIHNTCLAITFDH